jgi:hypothetical protein
MSDLTLLTVTQKVAKRLQLPPPSAVIGSTDNNVILIQAMLQKTIADIKDSFPWPELQREHTFTLANGTAAYILPGDFDQILNKTIWNRTQKWPLLGPVDPVEWQTWKSGLVTTLPRQRFRVKYWGDAQLFIDPTPGSGEDGQICVFEYISTNAIRPKTWLPSTTWTGIQYCSYNGNTYDRGGAGVATTGTSAPVHTSGAISDGSITWTYFNSHFPYDAFVYDSDVIILDNQMIIDGAVWRFKEERGLDYEDLRKQAEDKLEGMTTKLTGAGVVTINQARLNSPMIGPWSYPEGSY